MSHIFLVLLLNIFAMADEPKRSNLDQFLGSNQEVNTKESTVEVEGLKYRKVEYKNKTYYLRFLERTGEINGVQCNEFRDFRSPPLVEVSVKMTKRTRLFVEGLQETCSKKEGLYVGHLDFSPKIGLSFGDDQKDKIKNKKIFINPLNFTQMGLSGEF